MPTIVVTGAYGKVGRAVVSDLLAHEYDVVATDVTGPPGKRSDLPVPLMRADLTEYGEAIEALQGSDAVVHAAAIPAPGMFTPSHTFTANTAMNSNVFLAARQLGLSRVVWASSETTLGLPFGGDGHLRYAPVDEQHFPHPTSTYALSKVVGEALAQHVSQWSGITFVGLRLSNVHRIEDYARVPNYWADPYLRRWNLWGYVDARDAAAACRLGLEAAVTGSTNYVIAAADTIMNRPSKDLMREVFPDVSMTGDIGEFATLLAIDRAREVLGYEPQHSWRDHVETGPAGTDISETVPV